MEGKYCLRKIILCIQVIYFLFIFYVNLVLSILFYVIPLSPTSLRLTLSHSKKEGSHAIHNLLVEHSTWNRRFEPLFGDWMNGEDGLLNLGKHLDTSNAKVTHSLIHPHRSFKKVGVWLCDTYTHRVNWKGEGGRGYDVWVYDVWGESVEVELSQKKKKTQGWIGGRGFWFESYDAVWVPWDTLTSNSVGILWNCFEG